MANPLLLPVGISASIVSISMSFALGGDVLGPGLAVLSIAAMCWGINSLLDSLDLPHGDISGDDLWH